MKCIDLTFTKLISMILMASFVEKMIIDIKWQEIFNLKGRQNFKGDVWIISRI